MGGEEETMGVLLVSLRGSSQLTDGGLSAPDIADGLEPLSLALHWLAETLRGVIQISCEVGSPTPPPDTASGESLTGPERSVRAPHSRSNEAAE